MSTQNEKQSLNLFDLLKDEETNELSEYLSVSIENLEEGTKVSVTTVEENPTTYSSTISGKSFSDLQNLIDEDHDSDLL